jgi:hypothetical protein
MSDISGIKEYLKSIPDETDYSYRRDRIKMLFCILILPDYESGGFFLLKKYKLKIQEGTRWWIL